LNVDAPYQAEPIDVWGIGVILFTLLAGSMKYLISSVFIHLHNPFSPDTPWDEPTQHSPEFRRYLSGEIFHESPWNRLGSDAQCAYSCHLNELSPFFSVLRLKALIIVINPALLCGLLTVDPAQRMTLADVSQHPWCMGYAHSPRMSHYHVLLTKW
jgi:serine/threonine-protein kinase Chk1